MCGKTLQRVITLSNTAVRRIADKRFDPSSFKRTATDVALTLCVTLMIGSQPAAAQAGGELGQLVSLLNNLADLMQRVGLALAVLGFSAAGIAAILNKWRLAKQIAQNTLVGTVILLLSGAAVEYIASAF